MHRTSVHSSRQDIKHRLWPFTRKLSRDHPDHAVADADFNQLFDRLTEPFSSQPCIQEASGSEGDLRNAGGDPIPVPAGCDMERGRADLVERALAGYLLTPTQVCLQWRACSLSSGVALQPGSSSVTPW